MKLRNYRESPPGGWYYTCTDGEVIVGQNLRTLISMARDYLSANGNAPGEDFDQVVEDQICSRVPKSLCWKGFGDKVATVIHGVAGAIDKVAGTNLKSKAESCSSCAKRRRALNNISS